MSNPSEEADAGGGGPAPHLLSLPQECLSYLLGFLCVRDLNRFALVSRPALAAYGADEIWQPQFARRGWQHARHVQLAAQCADRALKLSDLRERLAHLAPPPASWRRAYAQCCRLEQVVVLEIGQRFVRFGFAGNESPEGETREHPGVLLRAAGQLQGVEDACSAVACALRSLGVPVAQAQLAIVTCRWDSVADVQALTVALLKCGVQRVRFVDADVAAMHAAGAPSGVSFYVGADYSSAAAIVDRCPVELRAASSCGNGRYVSTSMPAAPAHGLLGRQPADARGGSGVGGGLRLPVGTESALDELCALLSIAPAAAAARAELAERMRSSRLVYVRAISPARRQATREELELGQLELRLRCQQAPLPISAERYACLEHWLDPSARAGAQQAASKAAGAGAGAGAGAAPAEPDGLMQLLWRALRPVGEDDLPAVIRHILLHGEGACISGLDQRMANELRHSSPVPSVSCVRPKVALGGPRARLATWVGAASIVDRDQSSERSGSAPSTWVEADLLVGSKCSSRSEGYASLTSAVHAAILRGMRSPSSY